jgi:hypothetical protein
LDKPNRDILEAMECCRPGGEDVFAPEMAHLAQAIDADPALRAQYEEIQKSDAHLGRVFRDVTVPDGLEDRVLASLAGHEGTTDGVADHEVAGSENGTPGGEEAEFPKRPDDAVPQPAHSGRKRHAGRRWWYAAAVGAAAVVLVAVTFTTITRMSGDSEIPWEDFRQLVESSVSAAIDENDWNGDWAAVRDRPFPSDDFEINPIGWRHAPLGSFDDRATAYLLSDRENSEIVLLVSRPRTKVARVTEVCPSNSLPTSGNQSIGAWMSGGYLCVLVVRGRGHGRRYQSTIPQWQMG